MGKSQEEDENWLRGWVCCLLLLFFGYRYPYRSDCLFQYNHLVNVEDLVKEKLPSIQEGITRIPMVPEKYHTTQVCSEPQNRVDMSIGRWLHTTSIEELCRIDTPMPHQGYLEESYHNTSRQWILKVVHPWRI